MKLRDHRSILGVDPTKRGLAFVFFERGELIDWGSRKCGRELKNGLALLDVLVGTSAADIVVFENPDAEGCLRRARIRQFLRVAVAHATRQGLRVITVARREVRRTWRSRGSSTKQAIAAKLADELPELRHLVPLPRKVFKDEVARLQIFDALSLVLAASDRTPSVGR
jgi:hypothetical protein